MNSPGSSRPRRVLYVANSPDTFVKTRMHLVLAARAAGSEVWIAGPSGAATSEIRRLGFTYCEIDLERKGTNPFRELRTFFQLLSLYRRFRPDVVHHFTVKPVVYGGIAARLAHVPACVHTITGIGYVYTSAEARARLLRLLLAIPYKLALRHPNCRVIFLNQDDHDLFTRRAMVGRARARIIPGEGVDLNAFPASEERPGQPIVVLPARMLWDKGVAEFVAAAGELRDAGARFVLVGDTDDGNPAAIPRQQLERWAKSGVVEWWGWRSDIARVYQEAHIVCLPSYREGLPGTLIEAAASQRALVTTDAPGCREVVRADHTGKLVPPKDGGKLAAALRELIVSPEERRRLALAARHEAEVRFASEIVDRRILAIYDELVPAVA